MARKHFSENFLSNKEAGVLLDFFQMLSELVAEWTRQPSNTWSWQAAIISTDRVYELSASSLEYIRKVKKDINLISLTCGVYRTGYTAPIQETGHFHLAFSKSYETLVFVKIQCTVARRNGDERRQSVLSLGLFKFTSR